ncbi:MAG: sulfatase-like hydrolase/transferase, partial [Candidatus Latescibacteria bacterium]|nr:sulfatase-like hydrolase/transferase [Candidatus Latescibacterota bacterium]
MASDRPNVLLIMTDQQPVSTIGCYGNSVVKTPAHDRLAREGMRFDNFYIAAFPCTP